MIMAVNLELHLQRNIGAYIITKLTVNDTGSIVRRWSLGKLCALTRVGAHRFGDQCPIATYWWCGSSSRRPYKTYKICLVGL